MLQDVAAALMQQEEARVEEATRRVTREEQLARQRAGAPAGRRWQQEVEEAQFSWAAAEVQGAQVRRGQRRVVGGWSFLGGGGPAARTHSVECMGSRTAPHRGAGLFTC